MCICSDKKTGFTLVEVLVVIGILGLLLALLLPAIQQSREAARQGQCKSQLRQLGIGLLNHHDVHGKFPPGWTGKSESVEHDVLGPTGWGWGAHLLPFIEQDNLSNRIALDWLILHPANDVVRTQAIGLFHCPSDIDTPPLQFVDHGISLYELPESNYVANFGLGRPSGCDSLAFTGQQCDGGAIRGPFHHNSKVKLADFYYGSSNTVLVGERGSSKSENQAAATWIGAGPGIAYPFARILGTSSIGLNHDESVDNFRSWHPGGVFFVYGDAHVEMLRDQIEADVLAKATSIDLISESIQGFVDDLGNTGGGSSPGDDGSHGDYPPGDDGGVNPVPGDPPTGEYVPPSLVRPPRGGSGDGLCPICGEDTEYWWLHIDGFRDHKKPIVPAPR